MTNLSVPNARASSRLVILTALSSMLVAGCQAPPEAQTPVAENIPESTAGDPGPALDATDRRVAGLDSIFQPLPVLRPDAEQEMRRFGNAEQLRIAEQFGIDPDASTARLDTLRSSEGLVRLVDSPYWVVRELDASIPWVIPETQALLSDIGRRFQGRLADLGIPPLRFEITSALRSAEDQARLRETNPNAAAGLSTHQFGTTVDLGYNGFAAPADLEDWQSVDSAAVDISVRYARISLERMAARRSLEIQAILGGVLLELQREGQVMVTLERLQPVFHITVVP